MPYSVFLHNHSFTRNKEHTACLGDAGVFLYQNILAFQIKYILISRAGVVLFSVFVFLNKTLHPASGYLKTTFFIKGCIFSLAKSEWFFSILGYTLWSRLSGISHSPDFEPKTKLRQCPGSDFFFQKENTDGLKTSQRKNFAGRIL